MHLTLHEYRGNDGDSPLYVSANDIVTVGYSTEQKSTEVRLKGGITVYVTESPTDVLNFLRVYAGERWR